jgi:tripartite-type tricarboxylate transporter receptor subunit TctC
MPSFSRRALGGLALAGLAAPALASNAPLRIILTFARAEDGGPLLQAIGRLTGQALGRPVVIESITGGAGIEAASALLAAPADGSTVLVSTSALFTSLAMLVDGGLPFRPREDFQPITRVGMAPLVACVTAASPWRDAAAARDALAANPLGARLGTPGLGSLSHQFLALLWREWLPGAMPEPRHYDAGGNVLMAALAQGEVEFGLLPAAAAVPGIQQGRVRPLFVTSRYRAVWTRELEMVPTLSEIRPEFQQDVMEWWGVMARAGTPAAEAARLNAAFGSALEALPIRTGMLAGGVLPNPDPTPEDFARFWDAELPIRQGFVRLAGLRAH